MRIYTTPPLTITITEQVDESVGDALADRLRPFVPVEDVRHYFRKAAHIPQIIQIIGSIEAWHYLAAGATFLASKFLGRAVDLFATDAYQTIKDWLKSDEGKPITTAAAALSEAAKGAPGARIEVGLDIPDDTFGTPFEISANEPEAIAVELLRFVAHAETIVRVLDEADEEGDGAFGQPRITVNQNGDLQVRWMTSSDHKFRTVVITKRNDVA